MNLTMEQAKLRLQSINSTEELRNLIRSIDARGTGSTTVLWSGPVGFHGLAGQSINSGRIADSLQKINPNLRTLASTEIGKFLDLNRRSQNFNQQLSDKLNQLFQNDPDGIKEFLNGSVSGDPPRRTGKGVWDDVSERFVMQAKGDVRLVVGGAALDRVFGQTELHALLANPAITSIEGVPIQGLKDLAKTSGTEKVFQLLVGLSEANTSMIHLQVDQTGRPIQAPDGTYHADISDYMKMNTLNSTSPPGMRSIMEFIPKERLLRHQQAVEEIFNLNPILRAQISPPPIHADAFHPHSAISRIGTYAGQIGDVIDMTTMLAEAGSQLQQGDHRSAHDTVVKWVVENAGALSAGRLATLLVAPLMATGPVGMIIGAGIILGASIAGADLAKKLKKKLDDSYKEFEKMYSPLVLDLDGNGIQTLALKGHAIHFDHDSNGFAEKTGWVDPKDGLLILDLNQNGKVDNGRELFGNHTRLANGELAENGFHALARYDNNRDGRIDHRDPIWSQLRVWRDSNSNGTTEAGELLRLESVNAKALQLKFISSTEVDRNGNAHREKGFYERGSGPLAALTDVWFAKNTIESRQLQPLKVDAQTATLPNIPGIGIVPSLHQVLMGPKGGELRQTLSRWLQATRLERMTIKQQLLFQWCAADNNPFSMPERTFDETPLNKEKVAVVEKLMGQIIPETEDGVGTLRMRAVQTLSSEIEMYLDMILSNQVLVQPLIDRAIPVELSMHDSLSMDLKGSISFLRSQFLRDPDPAFLPMIQWQLAQRGSGGVAFFDALKKETSSQSDALGIAMRFQRPTSQPWEWKTGTAEPEDLAGGALDDFIEAGAGYDNLEGKDGNDTLHGGPGTDSYFGGSGGDTYIISQNETHAFDSVFDDSSPSGVADRVIFWDTPSSQVRLQQSAGSVSFYAGQRLLANIDKQLHAQHRIEEFHFSDGVIWDHNAVLLQLPILGTTGHDRLLGTAGTSNRFQGLAGNDTLIGGSLADHLEGQQGNDLLTGLAGRDTLDGGEGSDRLEGGEGGDRYHFAANGGHDRLLDLDQRTSEKDRVVFSHHNTSALTRVQRLGQDLQLHFGSSASLTLVNQLQPFSQIEEFQFANGQVWTHATLMQRVS